MAAVGKKLPIIPPTWSDLFKRLDRRSVFFLAIPHLLAIWGLFTISFHPKTFVLAFSLGWIATTTYIAGYHRLWSHRTFVPTKALEYVIAFVSTAAYEGPIIVYARGHRAHHRYIDTDLDPLMSKYGFWWRHLGFFTVKQNGMAPIDVSDLTSNPVVQWQKKYYLPMALSTGFILPTLIAGWGWGDWIGGFLFAGCLRISITNHLSSFANSLTHGIGEQQYDDRTTPRDLCITNFLTFGEGYHNYHHQFPMDYRVGIKWYHFDPAKWFIYFCYCLGLVSQINHAPENEVEKAKLSMKLKKLRDVQDRIKWPSQVDDLPVMDWETFQEMSKVSPLVVIAGFIHDVTSWIDQHPGGRQLLSNSIGQDATTSFFGGVYNHSSAAHNIMSMMRVGVLHGGVEHVVEQAVPPGQKLHIIHASELARGKI